MVNKKESKSDAQEGMVKGASDRWRTTDDIESVCGGEGGGQS